MPNWCITDVTFISENKNELKRLYDNLIKLYDIPCPVKNDFGNWWFGNIAIFHNLSLENLRCRGKIAYVDEFYLDDNCFRILTETAWEPLSEFWDKILEQYNNIKYVYMSEEPGAELYINSDTSGLIYPDRFKLDIYCEDYAKIKKAFPNIYNGVCPGFIEFFKNADELINYMQELTGQHFNEVEDILSFIDDINKKDNSYSVYVHEFESN